MKQHLNLLPEQFERRLVQRRCLALWTCIIVTLVTALGGLGYRRHLQLETARIELAETDARCRPLRATEEENVRIGHRLGELDGRESLLAHLNQGQPPLQLVGLVSNSARFVGDGLKVSLMSYRIVETVRPPAEGEPPAAPDKPPQMIETVHLTLNGIAADDLSVSKFILALRESGYFSHVELRSSVRSELASGRARSFQVECAL